MTLSSALRGLVSLVVLFGGGKFAIDLHARRIVEDFHKVTTSPVPELEQYLSAYFSCSTTWSANQQRCEGDTLITALSREQGVLVAAPEGVVGNYRVRLRCGPSVGRDTMLFEFAPVTREVSAKRTEWSRLFANRLEECSRG